MQVMICTGKIEMKWRNSLLCIIAYATLLSRIFIFRTAQPIVARGSGVMVPAKQLRYPSWSCRGQNLEALKQATF